MTTRAHIDAATAGCGLAAGLIPSRRRVTPGVPAGAAADAGDAAWRSGRADPVLRATAGRTAIVAPAVAP